MYSKTSLLTALRKYRPRDASDPLENFVTEAFAWLLSNHPDFGRFVLLQVTTAMQVVTVSSEALVTWTTQMNLGGKFPDLVCLAGDSAFIFEHKVWAGLGDSQLDNYRTLAATRFGKDRFKLILITSGTHQHDQSPDLALCWRDVHSWIHKWIGLLGNKSEFLFHDFCMLLESEGLGPPAPVSHEAILAYLPARTFETDVSRLADAVSRHPWHCLLPDGVANVESHKAGLWGRTGFYLLGRSDVCWSPGLFVGFMLEPEEHHLTWMNTSNPDFSIIISIHPSQHPGYEQLRLYRQMAEDLSSAISNSGTGFEFHHHIFESVHPEGPNRWHPIHIRKPMLELLRGTISSEDQEQRVIEQTAAIIEIITRCGSFWELRTELQKSSPVPATTLSTIS